MARINFYKMTNPVHVHYLVTINYSGDWCSIQDGLTHGP